MKIRNGVCVYFIYEWLTSNTRFWLAIVEINLNKVNSNKLNKKTNEFWQLNQPLFNRNI